MGGRVFRKDYNGHVDKTKRGGVEAREGGVFGWGLGKWCVVNAGNCNYTTIK